MLIIKKESKVEDKFLTIELPDEFKNQNVEIIVRLQRDIEKSLLVDQIRVDTKKWKFLREEIYAR
ncbi:MAG: hypothetical protein IBX72_16430 [Nitrospirae bacterium]|nr:hypothetical protein [Nitrospirota bacterium]